MHRIWLALSLLFCLHAVRAQEPLPPAGAYLQATADLALRASPPAGLFNASGAQTGVVPRGAVVLAKELRTVKDLFGSYLWYHVYLPDAKGAPESKSAQNGWVYAGAPGGPLYLKPVPKAAPPARPK